MKISEALSLGGLDVYVFTPTISTTVYNYNVNSAATSAGWDGIKPLYCTITVTGTGRIESTSVGSNAFVLSALPAGSPAVDLNILAGGVLIGAEGLGGAGGALSGVGANNGGDGGQGGACINVSYAIRINNAGSIFGGGGGSGGGGNAGNISGGPALLAGGGKGQGSDGAATAGGYDEFSGRSASGGAGGTGGPGLSGSLGGGGGFFGSGGAQGANGNAVVGISNVTYTARGTIVGAEI